MGAVCPAGGFPSSLKLENPTTTVLLFLALLDPHIILFKATGYTRMTSGTREAKNYKVLLKAHERTREDTMLCKETVRLTGLGVGWEWEMLDKGFPTQLEECSPRSWSFDCFQYLSMINGHLSHVMYNENSSYSLWERKRLLSPLKCLLAEETH